MPDEIPLNLRNLVESHAGREMIPLTWETRLVHDLMIMGDDFHELLETAQIQFKTDFSKIRWTDYAPCEFELINEWLGKDKIIAECKPLTIKMLHEAILAGTWTECDMEPERRIVNPALFYWAQILGLIAILIIGLALWTVAYQ